MLVGGTLTVEAGPLLAKFFRWPKLPLTSLLERLRTVRHFVIFGELYITA